MTVKRTFKQRALSLFIAMTMIFTMIPFSLLTTLAADRGIADRVVDPSTMNDWVNYFPISGNLTTENAGKVWMDKSVFLDVSAFNGINNGISKNDNDSFLVALSTIASSMSIKGMSNVPTDSVLILDISGSMNSSNNDVAEELVEAANTSIAALLNTNKYNRVSVILYSSNATTMLPLGRYTTGTDGEYLTYSGNWFSESIEIDSNVRIEGTDRSPSSISRNVTGGTYIQSGLSQAVDMLIADSNSTTVTDPALGTVDRKPVVVLMSDGAPTYGTTNFSDPGDSNLGSGGNTTAALGFVTQLTAAYSKAKIEEKYGTECLFYTLGLGIGRDSIALAVMDPQNSNASTAVDDFWNNERSYWDRDSFDGYNNINVGETVSVSNNRSVTKVSTPLEQYYVDKYFSAEAETLPNGTVITMADKLKQAFQDIVSEIQLQSAYFPTLIKDSEEHSGFVSFVDRIGEYMEVTDVKGILIHDDLFSGADLASNFVAGGGALGTFDAPSELGVKMVEAVQIRLGISDKNVAETLIELAYRNGQLYYEDENNYSNYIGWYANAAGEFLGFYHEGVTTLPAPTGDVDTDPAFTIKSYGYLGEVDAEHGVSKSDMMFATVQVRKNISTSEEIVTFAVPAALIPVVNYEVSLDENNDLADLTVKGATAPIRLVYEVALRSDINSFNVKDKVSSEYLADVHNVNSDGSVNFYTNQWDHQNTTGYGTINTYSYFNPSKQNESYYYIEDTTIYSDTNGTVYTSTDEPTGDKYYAYNIYKHNGTLRTDTIYRKIDPKVLEVAGMNADNTWYIPQGSVHINIGAPVSKTANNTGTLSDTLMPFVDTHGHTANDTGFYYYIGATLGNNGKLSVMPETGIKLTKVMADGTTAPDTAFEFVITDLNDTTTGKVYTALYVDADGREASGTVTFTQGTAVVRLKAGETLYIGGMSENEEFRIEEKEVAEYVSSSTGLSNNGTIIPVGNTIQSVVFENAARGKGSFVITKVVEHDYGTSYQLPSALSFKMKVTLVGIGTANTTFDTKLGTTLSTVKTDANGSFEVELKHGESFEVFGVYEGTVVTVAEQNIPNGFTAAYVEDGVVGDGVVTVVKDAKVSVEVLNSYEAEPVDPVPITVTVNKTINRNWESNYEFEFVLEKYDSGNWVELGRVTADSSDTVTFTNAFANEKYDKIGTYFYRVIEIEPTSPLGGFTYDKHVHSFYAVVTDDNMDGQLEINRIVAGRDDNRTVITGDEQNGFIVSTRFENVYSNAGSSATVTVEVNKAINNIGGSDKSLAGYEFGLFDSEGRLVGTTLKTTERGFARFILSYTGADAGNTFNYTLKEIKPATIPEGWSYSAKEVSVKVDVVDNNNGTISAYVYTSSTRPAGATNNISESFVNEYNPVDAELTVNFVTKELTGRNQNAGEFNFEIQGVTDPSMTPIKGTNTADGKVVFDSALKISSVGTYIYNIVETGSDGNGLTLDKTVYRVVVTVTDDGNGQLVASYIVTNDADDKIVFKNTYTPTPITNSIKGDKVLQGRPLLNDEFTFVLTEFTVDGQPVANPKSYEVKNLITGAFEFEAITYTKKGTYTYKVTEKGAEGNTFGVDYDETVFIYTVVIGDDGQGTLSVEDTSVALENASAPNGLTFVNVYNAQSTSATINGDKTLTGKVDNALKGEEFEFILYEANNNWVYSDETKVETVSNKAGGTFEFTKIDFDTDEDKYYVVVEKNGGQTIKGITYDDTVYLVYVEVTDDHKGQLHAKLHIYDQDGIPQDSISFVNVYEVTGNAEVKLSGNKTLNGREWTDDDKFTFELFGADSAFQISGTPINTVEVNKTVRGYEIKLNYTPSDVGNTYYYVLREKNGGQKINGVVYGNTEYHITVVVSDNDDGTIKTVTTVENATTSTLDFVNEYEITGSAEVDLSGDKTLNGRDWTNSDKFTFELYNANSSFVANGNAIKTDDVDVTNKTFEIKLEYTPADVGNTYYYVLKEKNGGQNIGGITYSNAEYHITVVVSDNGDGTFKAVANVVGAEVDALDFTNEYAITGSADVTLAGEKSLGGRDWTSNDKFTFELYNANSSFAINGNAIKTDEVNAANKNLEIKLEYTPSDVGNTYYYVLKEKNAGQTINGITYSNVEYHVTVVVRDNGDGTFGAFATVAGAGVSTLDFVNTYEITGNAEVILSGDKTLNGRDWTNDDKFTFELYNANSSFVVNGNAIKTDDVDVANKTFEIKLNYTPADVGNTYYYVLKEKNAGQKINGVTYSDAEYHITVVVGDNGDGTIKTVTTVKNATNTTLDFVNVYEITGTSNVKLSGEKALESRDFTTNDIFTFELYKANASFVTSGAAIKSDDMDQNTHRFEIELDYQPSDVGNTYYYVLREKNGGQTINGVTYSSTEYHITVVVSDNGDGTIKSVATVENATVNTLDFTNVYKITGTSSVKLSGEKKLEGRDWTNGDKFTFELYGANSSFVTSGAAVKTAEVDINAKSFEIELSYQPSDVGNTYYYVLKEANGGQTINGVTYSGVEYHITVVVSDNGDGTIKTVATVENGAADQLNFVNAYTITGNAEVTLSGDKTLNGREWTNNDGFTFELFNADSAFVANGSAIKSDAVDSADKSFEIKLNYQPSDVGNTYYYVLKESNAGQKINGVTYSNVEYHITVVVSDNGDGAIKAVATVENGTVDNLDFTNKYEITGTASVELSGEKKLDGRDFTANDKFKFELYKADSAFVISGNAVETADMNATSHKFEINLDYQPSDVGNTYYYVLKETNAGQTINNVTYSSTEYHITVVVSDNGDGTIKTVATVENSAVDKLNFVNVFIPDPENIKVNVNIDKTVVNTGKQTIGPEGFEFVLDSDIANVEDIKVKTDEKGKAVIALEFSMADIGKTYTYKLREINDGREYVQYSKAEYAISIAITHDKSTNKLVATIKVDNKAADTVDASFENVYSGIPESPQTGYNGNIGMWAVMLFISGGAVITLTTFDSKKKKSN